jgi:hypothetical protein
MSHAEIIEVEANVVESEDNAVQVSANEFAILSQVSAVHAQAPAPARSERYKVVKTFEVIDALREVGFYVDRAHYTKTRKNKKGEAKDPLYAKHQVVLRNEQFGDYNGVTPEFLITNAHDGTSSVDLMAGAYRFICSNGLIIGETFSRERIRHSGNAAAMAIDRAMRMSRNVGKWLKQVEEWKAIDLSAPQRLEFARLANVLRFGDPHKFETAKLLEVRRPEDDRGDLWTTFNVIQENAMKGGFEGFASTGRRATARPLKEIAKTSAFNADLWILAEEFAE